jgi:hypothetical protein
MFSASCPLASRSSARLNSSSRNRRDGRLDPLAHLRLGFEKDAAEALDRLTLPADEDRVRTVLIEALLAKGLIHIRGRLAKPREAIRTGRRLVHGNQSST